MTFRTTKRYLSNSNAPRTALTMAASAGVVAFIALLSGCDRTPDTIKIGVAQPLTGKRAERGQDLLNGVNLAVANLNKEGFKIKGKTVKIEVVALDDKADIASGKLVAQQLVDAGVVAVIGHLLSGVSIGAAPIYAAAHIPQLAISTNPKFTQLELDTTFRLVANDTLQAKAIGSFAAKQLGANKFAVLDDSTLYGKGLADGAAEELKKASKSVVLRQSFDDKITAFDELANKLKEEQVEVVVSTLNDFQLLALIDALKKISYTQLSILGGDSIRTIAMLAGSESVKGLYATSPILAAKEFPNGAKFLSEYRDAYKIDPAYGGHYSYDAMYVLAQAMNRANSVEPKKITAILRTLDGFAPVTGSLKWDKVGEQAYGVVGVYAARKGVWELQMRSDRW